MDRLVEEVFPKSREVRGRGRGRMTRWLFFFVFSLVFFSEFGLSLFGQLLFGPLLPKAVDHAVDRRTISMSEAVTTALLDLGVVFYSWLVYVTVKVSQRCFSFHNLLYYG